MKTKFNKKLAIFDIDGTLFRSSLVIELVNELLSQGLFADEVREEVAIDHIAWLNRQGSYENYIYKVVTVYRKHIVGRKVNDLQKVIDTVISTQKDKLYRFTRDSITYLKKHGYDLLALSGSPLPIVLPFSESLGITMCCGSGYEVRNGIIEVAGDTLNKKEELLLFLKSHNNVYNLKDSVAVGDTEGDIPIMTMVGYPIAFNPNNTLISKANRKNWPVIVERKDVIYNINNSKQVKTAASFLREYLPIA
ncbi:MAG: hypothetical protein RI947_456 [Candidatus Parcubacteria bacterium]|jgi:HAD superfamily hydrolase (TIGR01490 family)